MTHPFPPLTPSDPREIAAALSAVLGDAWDRIEREYQLVLASVDLGRNDLVLAQLDEFKAAVTEFQRVVDVQARAFAQSSLPALYATGAQASDPRATFVWTQSDIDALTSLASDSYGDFLRRSQDAGRTSEQFAAAVRDAAKKELPQLAAGRSTSTQAATALRNRLEQEHGISAAVYADGSLHSMREYTQMAALTKGAVAYNFGALNRVSASGAKFVEVFDGPDCGWTTHDDPDTANGTVRSLQAAFAFPISHPRCVRSFGGRPDILNADMAAAAKSSIPEETQAANREAEAARHADAAARATVPVRPRQAARDRLQATREARQTGSLRPDLANALASLVKSPPDADGLEQLMQHAATVPGDYLSQQTAAKLAKATYEMSWARDGIGFRTQVDEVTFSVGPVTSVRGGVYSAGERIGSFTRNFEIQSGQLVAEHALLELKEEFREHRLGTAFTQFSEAFYRTHGVKAITTYASSGHGYNGGFTWARAGFEIATVRSALELAAGLREVAQTVPAVAVQAHALALRLEGPEANWPTPYEISELGHFDLSADTWPGRDFLLAASWFGVKLLP